MTTFLHGSVADYQEVEEHGVEPQEKQARVSLSLSSVYRFISGSECLAGAHDSLVDVGAQSDIILHKYFIPYLDRTDSVCTVENIFGKMEKKPLEKIGKNPGKDGKKTLEKIRKNIVT